MSQGRMGLGSDGAVAEASERRSERSAAGGAPALTAVPDPEAVWINRPAPVVIEVPH